MVFQGNVEKMTQENKKTRRRDGQKKERLGMKVLITSGRRLAGFMNEAMTINVQTR